MRQLRAVDRRLAAVLARGERGLDDLAYLQAAVGEVEMNLDVIEVGDDDLCAPGSAESPRG